MPVTAFVRFQRNKSMEKNFMKKVGIIRSAENKTAPEAKAYEAEPIVREAVGGGIEPPRGS